MKNSVAQFSGDHSNQSGMLIIGCTCSHYSESHALKKKRSVLQLCLFKWSVSCLWFQAIMMSICLQSMVDELMVKKSGGSIKKVCWRKPLFSPFIGNRQVFVSGSFGFWFKNKCSYKTVFSALCHIEDAEEATQWILPPVWQSASCEITPSTGETWDSKPDSWQWSDVKAFKS